ncbi:MAG: hypothetical protein IJA86_03425 [Clostridia bacterium]|nr:hypothetical protein [Clostridia bacterium]
MPAILKIKDKDGKIYTIPAIRGEKGEKGREIKAGKHLLLNEKDEMSLDISQAMTDTDTRPVSGNVIKSALQALQTALESTEQAKAGIETGFYIGTGNFGEEEPNQLTFSFVPKFLCICKEHANGECLLWISGMPKFLRIGESETGTVHARVSDRTVIFYSTEDPLVQYNNITVKYYYTAFG